MGIANASNSIRSILDHVPSMNLVYANGLGFFKVPKLTWNILGL